MRHAKHTGNSTTHARQKTHHTGGYEPQSTDGERHTTEMPTATRATHHTHTSTRARFSGILCRSLEANHPVDACFGYTRRERRHDPHQLSNVDHELSRYLLQPILQNWKLSFHMDGTSNTISELLRGRFKPSTREEDVPPRSTLAKWCLPSSGECNSEQLNTWLTLPFLRICKMVGQKFFHRTVFNN